jgi:hypothetical protein
LNCVILSKTVYELRDGLTQLCGAGHSEARAQNNSGEPSGHFWRKTKIAAINVRDATIPLQAISQTRERSKFRAISEPARV